MVREKIELEFKSWNDFENSDEIQNFKWITDTQEGFDSEKGFADIRVVLQRVSDNKFFDAEYTKLGQGEDEWNGILTEVFPRTIQATVYE